MLSLSVGEPDFPPPPEVMAAMHEALNKVRRPQHRPSTGSYTRIHTAFTPLFTPLFTRHSHFVHTAIHEPDFPPPPEVMAAMHEALNKVQPPSYHIHTPIHTAHSYRHSHRHGQPHLHTHLTPTRK